MKKETFKSAVIQELNEMGKLSFFHWFGFMVCCVLLSDFIFEQKMDWRLLGMMATALLAKMTFSFVKKLSL